MNRLSIVVPAYNEADHIDEVVTSLISSRERILKQTDLNDVEIIVVNDGSSDDTEQKVTRLLGAPYLKLVNHELNQGYGAALKTGFSNSTGEWISFMDGDGTINPDSFIRMYVALQHEEADMVVGTRFGKRKSGMPFTRKMGNRFFATLLTFLSGQKIQDTASGIRLFRKTLVPL